MHSMYIKRNEFIRLLLLSALLCISAGMLFSNTSVLKYNVAVLCTMSINLLYAFWNIIAEAKKQAFSFSLMFWMFNFVFFGIAPIIQHISNCYFWGLRGTDSTSVFCNVLIFFWMLLFNVGKTLKFKEMSRIRFRFFSPVILGAHTQKNKELSECSMSRTSSAVCLILEFVLVFYLVSSTGINRILFRGGHSNLIFFNSSIELLHHHVIRNLIYSMTILQISCYQKKRDNLKMPVIALILMLVGCFPTGLSRYMIAAYYGGLMFAILKNTKIGQYLSFFFLGALLILFPILSSFRSISGDISYYELFSRFGRELTSTYLTANYDAYQMFMGAVKYTQIYGFSMGRQLLGALLFFIPRRIWKNKPIGSGATIIIALRTYSFTNVSMPLIGESYINFGIFGLIVFALFAGWITNWMDNYYWSNNDTLQEVNSLYPSAILYFFFLNRGDMLSAGAYMTANVVVGMFTHRLFISSLHLKNG